MKREEVFKYIFDTFGVDGEFLWQRDPHSAIFRHNGNKKWFVVAMLVSKNKLGLSGSDLVEIINVKCEPPLIPLLKEKKGVLAAYHMNKEHWLTLLLDEGLEKKEFFDLIDLSFELTKEKKK